MALVDRGDGRQSQAMETGRGNSTTPGSRSEEGLMCPDCGSDTIHPVRDLDGVVLRCDSCTTAWRLNLGFIQRVRLPGNKAWPGE
jgi:hypothetical protein